MARPSAAFIAASRDYVCVRITDMQAIDIDRYRFDFDLTLAILLANSDGTVYHRIGGRTWRDALAWMSLDFVVRVMKSGLATHREYQGRGPKMRKEKGQPGLARSTRTIFDIATFRAKIARGKKRPSCIHCHTIHDAEIRHAQAEQTFRPRDRWIWPAPARIGLTMVPEDQARIGAVAPASIAARAGLRADDRLLELGDQRVLTVHDIQWVLHRAPYDGGELTVSFLRDGKRHQVPLELSSKFKVTDPLTYSWRPYKWALRPAPGLGGPLLDAATKRRVGLQPNDWAFRVQYIVDWGERPQQGRENRRQGLEIGDVVFSYAGKRDFETVAHFHAWVRLTRRRGEVVEIGVLRGGQRRRIRVTLQ